MPFEEIESIEGYDAFTAAIDKLAKKQPLFILFTGSESSNGKSWCPDCVQFEGMWSKLTKPSEGTFIRVKVGPMDFWKDKNCPFRTDKALRLQSIPTLVQWGTAKRLNDDAIQSPENVKMLMEED